MRSDNEITRAFDGICPSEEELMNVARRGKKPAPRRPWGRIALAACLALSLLLGGLGIANGSKLFVSPPTVNPPAAEEGKSPSDYGEIFRYLNTPASRVEFLYSPLSDLVGGSDGRLDEGVDFETPSAPSPDSSNLNSVPSGNDRNEGEHSDTNVQHAGVMEGDIVKTDGKFIYFLRKNTLRVIRASDGFAVKSFTVGGSTYHEEDKTSTLCTPVEMFLAGDRLVILCSEGEALYSEDGQMKEKFESLKQEYTKQYESMAEPAFASVEDYLVAMGILDEEGDPADGLEYRVYERTLWSTRALILDVAEPTAPRLVDSFAVSGSLVSSRMIADVLVLVANQWIHGELSEDRPEDYVPYLSTPEGRELVSVDRIHLHSALAQKSYLNVLSYDLATLEQVDLLCVLGGGEDLYASHESLYILGKRYESSIDKNELRYRSSTRTYITRIALENGKLSLASQTSLEGEFGDQFFFDEYLGHLRMVLHRNTRCYRVEPFTPADYLNYWIGGEALRYEGVNYRQADEPDGESLRDNVLLILDLSLKEVSRIENLAEGEDLKSVRFDGEIGYFVTYLQVDPLFAVDLSDPKQPKILSELKIPGFSTYLQTYGKGMLLGVGRDDSGFVKLSMFDVSDKTDVKETAVLVSDRWYSGTLDDHKAILADSGKNLIGLATGSGYLVYTYCDGEFVLLAEADAGSNSYVRGLYANGLFYVIGYRGFAVYSMEDWSLVEEVSFPLNEAQSIPGLGWERAE